MKMHVCLLLIALPCAVFVLMPGCAHDKYDGMDFSQKTVDRLQKNYDLTIRSGIRDWPYPRDFNRMFAGTFNSISYYTGVVGDPRWNSNIGLYGKYRLRVILPIKLNDARTSIVSMGAPVDISLDEFGSPILNGNGRRAYPMKRIASLSTNDWTRLVGANGNFGVLNIKLETNGPPVEGFEDIWPRF